MAQILLVSTFGMVGVLARYFLNFGNQDTAFPTMTMVINIVGSLLIGIIYVLGLEREILSQEMRLAIMTGLLGGFTTFSAFSLDTIRMIERGAVVAAAFYVGTSVVLGICATAGGIWIARVVVAKT